MPRLLLHHKSGMRAAFLATVAMMAIWPSGLTPAAGLWSSPVSATNVVVSSPTSGGGYAELPPTAGGCVAPSPNNFNANHSESHLAINPGSERIVGSSKFFFDKFSTNYNFYLGSYNIDGTSLSHSNNIVQGYDCSTTETKPGVLNQNMPPSWTNTTDPNVGFDTKGRVYQTMLPFNAFWTNLHPDGEITVSSSDDLGKTWTIDNGGQALEQVPNSSSFQLGHVEDKQWIAVNHYPNDNKFGNKFQDHVYATWDIVDGNVGSTVKLRAAVSGDRGLTFSKATTIVSSSIDQLRDQFSQPAVDPSGDLYVAYTNIGTKTNVADFFVTKSSNDGQTFSTPVQAGTGNTIGVASGRVTNTTFRDGINYAFAVSQDFPGHLYLAYNDFNGTQYNTFLVQSTDGGQTWSQPVPVNDDIASGRVADHFQPAVAAGPWPSPSTTAGRPARTMRASFRRTAAGQTSASTCRSSHTRTVAPAPWRSGRTSGRRTPAGTRSSPDCWSILMAPRPTCKRWEALARWRAPRTTIPAGSPLSAITLGSPSRGGASTPCPSPRTMRRM